MKQVRSKTNITRLFYWIKYMEPSINKQSTEEKLVAYLRSRPESVLSAERLRHQFSGVKRNNFYWWLGKSSNKRALLIKDWYHLHWQFTFSQRSNCNCWTGWIKLWIVEPTTVFSWLVSPRIEQKFWLEKIQKSDWVKVTVNTYFRDIIRIVLNYYKNDGPTFYVII